MQHNAIDHVVCNHQQLTHKFNATEACYTHTHTALRLPILHYTQSRVATTSTTTLLKIVRKASVPMHHCHLVLQQ
jgi:hypothetical protein